MKTLKSKRMLLAISIVFLLTFSLGLIPIINNNQNNRISYRDDAVIEKLNNYASTSGANSYEAVNKQRVIIKQLTARDIQGVTYRITDYSPSSYDIYALTNNGDVFIEASDESNSIYYLQGFSEVYYGGVGNYYGFKNNTWYNLINGSKLDGSPQTFMEFNFDNEANAPSTFSTGGSDTPLDYATTYDGVYTVINDYQYFANLINFPDHVLEGTCGVVAVAMLLGYYNTKMDLIPQRFLDGNGTNNEFARYLFYNWVWDGKSAVAQGTIMGVYKLTGNDAGFPMAAVENKALITRYLNTVNPYNIKHICSGWYPKTNTKKQINIGRPIIGTSTSFTVKNGSKESGYHNLIIYGYSGDNFMCHMGWGLKNIHGLKQY